MKDKESILESISFLISDCNDKSYPDDLIDNLKKIHFDIENLIVRQRPEVFLVAKVGRVEKKIPISDVEYVLFNDRCVIIRDVKGRDYTSNKTLKEIEDLAGDSLVRVNRSCLAMVSAISRIEKNKNGFNEVFFRKSNESFRISRRLSPAIRRSMSEK